MLDGALAQSTVIAASSCGLYVQCGQKMRQPLFLEWSFRAVHVVLMMKLFACGQGQVRIWWPDVPGLSKG